MQETSTQKLKNELFFSSKIFGRLEEQTIFNNALKQFINGIPTTINVSGERGVGKTFFIKSLSRSSNDCLFHSGRYKNSSRTVPYIGIKEVFESIITNRLNKKDDNLKKWKQDFNLKFSPYYTELKSIISISPELLLEDNSSASVSLSPYIVKNRIINILLDFISFILENQNEKLIILLDDIQWADKESFAFIKALLLKKHKNLLLVLSNINSNDTESNLFLKNELIIGTQINLEPFEIKDFSQLFNQRFEESNNGEVNLLIDYCYSVSNGNPLILKEVISNLIRTDQIKYDVKNENWHLNLSKLNDKNDSFNQIIRSKIDSLSDETKQIIELSSCFGLNLNTPFISKICDIEFSNISKAYEEASELGIVKSSYLEMNVTDSTTNDVSYEDAVLLGFLNPTFLKKEKTNINLTNYEFSNEIIQKDFWSNFEIRKRQEIHKKIANYYINDPVLGLDDRDIFETVYHINESITKTATKKEKLIHVEINLRALKKAKSSASFSLATTFINQIINNELSNDWTSNYDLATEVHLEGYQIFRLSNNNIDADKLYQRAILNCKKLDANTIRLSKISLDIQFGELDSALDTGIIALNSLGLTVRKKATKLSVVYEFVKTRLMLIGKETDYIYNLPELKDKNTILIFRIIFWMYRSAQFLNIELSGVLALKSLQLTLEKGTNGNAYSGLMAYGVIIGAGTNNYKTAYKFCEVGSKLAKKYNFINGGVEFGTAIYSAYRFSLRDTLIHYSRSKKLSYREGDFLAAAEPTINESLTYLSAGFPLSKVKDIVQENYSYCFGLSMKNYQDFQLVLGFQVDLLSGKTLDNENKDQINSILANTQYKFTPAIWGVLELQRSCLNSDWDKAIQITKEIKTQSQILSGLYILTEFYFYKCIAILKHNNYNYKSKIKVKTIIKKMNKWADSAPENHIHKLWIIEGLVAEKNGDYTLALDLLNKAAEEANRLKFIQISAIAYWFSSQIHESNGDKHEAINSENLSKKLFNEWGCDLVFKK